MQYIDRRSADQFLVAIGLELHGQRLRSKLTFMKVILKSSTDHIKQYLKLKPQKSVFQKEMFVYLYISFWQDTVHPRGEISSFVCQMPKFISASILLCYVKSFLLAKINFRKYSIRLVCLFVCLSVSTIEVTVFEISSPIFFCELVIQIVRSSSKLG